MDKTFYTEEDFIRFPNTTRYNDKYEVSRLKAKAGDVVLANENGDKLFVTLDDYKTNWKNSEEFTPIAICVIPARHTNDGTCRCMSILWMQSDSDVAGDNVSSIPWCSSSGVLEEGVSNTSSFNYTPIGTTTVAVYGAWMIPTNYESWGNSYYTSAPLGEDPIPTKYRAYLSGMESPYGADGISKNNKFFISGGICDYMNGKENTIKLVNGTYSHLAADRCNAYSTIGTKAGDWYLPEIGELIYIPVRGLQIYESFDELNKGTTSGKQIISGYSSQWVCSSTQCYTQYHVLNTAGCNTTTTSQINVSTVLAFIAI